VPSPSPSAEPTVTPATPATPSPPPATPTPKLPYDVVNGFGQIYTRNPAVRDRIGLPLGNEGQADGAYLAFEGGVMLWRGDTRTIYVLFNSDPGVWYAFTDSWVEGMDPGGGAGPVAGEYKPKRGFGKVWAEQPDVQKRLGYALTADEVGTQFGVQTFERGLMLWTNASGKPFIYVLYQNNLYERYADVSP
jgi:hypothetical protein